MAALRDVARVFGAADRAPSRPDRQHRRRRADRRLPERGRGRAVRRRGADRARRPQCRARSGGRDALSHRRRSGRRDGRRRRPVRRGRQSRRAPARHGRARRGADLAGGLRPGPQQAVDRLRVPGSAPAQEPGRAGAGVPAAVRHRGRRGPALSARDDTGPSSRTGRRPADAAISRAGPRAFGGSALRHRLGRTRRHQPAYRRWLLLGGLAGHSPAQRLWACGRHLC